MVATSSDRGLQVPTVAGDFGVWGNELNTTITALDSILGGTTLLPSTTYGTAATVTSSEAQTGRIEVTGALSGLFTLTMPASNYCNGLYQIWNNTTGGFGVLVQTLLSSGLNVTVPSGAARLVWVDGVNAYFTDNQPVVLPNPATSVNFCISGSGFVPQAPAWYGVLEIPFSFTTSSYVILAETAGTCQVNIYHQSYASWNTVSLEASLTLSGQFKSGGSYGPVRYNPGDLMGFYLNSAATLTSVSVTLAGTRSLSS